MKLSSSEDSASTSTNSLKIQRRLTRIDQMTDRVNKVITVLLTLIIIAKVVFKQIISRKYVIIKSCTKLLVKKLTCN